MIEKVKMYILDTKICISLIKKDPNASQKFEEKALECYTSTIVSAELYKGVYFSSRTKENLAKLNEFLTLLAVIDFDHAAAEEFGKIQAELKSIGQPTGEIDAFIAAVARSQQAILVTDNIRYFKNIKNLQLENWLDCSLT